MSRVEKLLRLKDFSESFALTAAECFPDREAGAGEAQGGIGDIKKGRCAGQRPFEKGSGSDEGDGGGAQEGGEAVVLPAQVQDDVLGVFDSGQELTGFGAGIGALLQEPGQLLQHTGALDLLLGLAVVQLLQNGFDLFAVLGQGGIVGFGAQVVDAFVEVVDQITDLHGDGDTGGIGILVGYFNM